MDKNLDEMIKSYSDELMDYARAHNSESLVLKKAPPEAESAEGEAVAEEAEETPEEMPLVSDEDEMQKVERREESPEEIPSEEDMENFALFKGRVFTGFGAFPIENAKVILYKGDILYAFLTTDKSGETPTIKIEAFPEKNSLEPLSDEQSTDYSADVYADGFLEKKNLLVSAVGGSDVVLEAELTPESEAIS